MILYCIKVLSWKTQDFNGAKPLLLYAWTKWGLVLSTQPYCKSGFLFCRHLFLNGATSLLCLLPG